MRLADRPLDGPVGGGHEGAVGLGLDGDALAEGGAARGRRPRRSRPGLGPRRRPARCRGRAGGARTSWRLQGSLRAGRSWPAGSGPAAGRDGRRSTSRAHRRSAGPPAAGGAARSRPGQGTIDLPAIERPRPRVPGPPGRAAGSPGHAPPPARGGRSAARIRSRGPRHPRPRPASPAGRWRPHQAWSCGRW